MAYAGATALGRFRSGDCGGIGIYAGIALTEEVLYKKCPGRLHSMPTVWSVAIARCDLQRYSRLLANTAVNAGRK